MALAATANERITISMKAPNSAGRNKGVLMLSMVCFVMFVVIRSINYYNSILLVFCL